MIPILHLVDVIPFILATLVVLLGATKLSFSRPISVLIISATLIYILAQSSWFSAWLSGDEWGRDWANALWFIFNTSTMVVFLWTLFSTK